MKAQPLHPGLAILFGLLGILSSLGQNYSIDWFKIAGGGGTSTNGQYSVSGTIGQPDAGGQMSGGNYSIIGGFWSLVAALQSPGAPLLTITRSNNSVVVLWPSPSTGFVLQQNTSVTNPSGWQAFGGTINDNGTSKSVTITSHIGTKFYRLKE